MKIFAVFWQLEQTTSKLRDPHEPVDGRYYYPTHPQTLILQHDAPGTLLECPESASNDDRCPHPTGIWKVEVTETRVTGTWRASADAPLKLVDLTRHATGSGDSIGAFYARQHDDKPRAVAREAKRHGIVWRTTRRGSGDDSRTGSIVLLRSPNPAARERINRWLKAAIRWPDTQKECEDHPESCEDGWDVDVLFANERWLAIGGMAYWSGGAHPSNEYSAYTFDLQTGQEVDWTTILRVNDATAGPDTPLDLDRRDLLAAYVLRAAMADTAGCLSAAAGSEGYDCDGDRCRRGPEVKYYFWPTYPTPEGLAVAPDVYPEANRGCRGETVIVPWASVREMLLAPIAMP